MLIWFPLLLIFLASLYLCWPKLPIFYNIIIRSKKQKQWRWRSKATEEGGNTRLREDSVCLRVFRLKAAALQIPLCFTPWTEVLVIRKVPTASDQERSVWSLGSSQEDHPAVVKHDGSGAYRMSFRLPPWWVPRLFHQVGWERFMKLCFVFSDNTEWPTSLQSEDWKRVAGSGGACLSPGRSLLSTDVSTLHPRGQRQSIWNKCPQLYSF